MTRSSLLSTLAFAVAGCSRYGEIVDPVTDPDDTDTIVVIDEILELFETAEDFPGEELVYALGYYGTEPYNDLESDVITVVGSNHPDLATELTANGGELPDDIAVIVTTTYLDHPPGESRLAPGTFPQDELTYTMVTLVLREGGEETLRLFNEASPGTTTLTTVEGGELAGTIEVTLDHRWTFPVPGGPPEIEAANVTVQLAFDQTFTNGFTSLRF